MTRSWLRVRASAAAASHRETEEEKKSAGCGRKKGGRGEGVGPWGHTAVVGDWRGEGRGADVAGCAGDDVPWMRSRTRLCLSTEPWRVPQGAP